MRLPFKSARLWMPEELLTHRFGHTCPLLRNTGSLAQSHLSPWRRSIASNVSEIDISATSKSSRVRLRWNRLLGSWEYGGTKNGPCHPPQSGSVSARRLWNSP